MSVPFEAEISLTTVEPITTTEDTTKPTPKDLSYISDRLQLIEPTLLYNLIQLYIQSNHNRSTIVIIDVRSYDEYARDHIQGSIWCGPSNAHSNCSLPYDIEFETVENLVVIDNSAVTNLDEHSIACKYGIAIAHRLPCKVMIVMGGYERFSAEYPFLRTAKIEYTCVDLEGLVCYPAEIVPLLLYVGCQDMVRNVEINRDLKIKCHIFAFPKEEYTEMRGISHSHANFADFKSTLNECYNLIELHRHRAERSLVACALGINESAVIACGYLMRRHRIGLLKAYSHVKKCMHSIRPNTLLIRGLLEYEKTLFSDLSVLSSEKEVMQLVRLESTPFYL